MNEKKTQKDYETEEALKTAITEYLIDHGAKPDQVSDIVRMMIWQATVGIKGQNMLIGFVLMIVGMVFLSAILTFKELLGGD